MRTVFLILSTDNIGGAEKRFFGLWKALVETNTDFSYKLVITPQLHRALRQQEKAEVLFKYTNSHIIEQDFPKGFKAFRSAIRSFNAQYVSANDILHFIGDHPLFHASRQKQVFSITQSSLKNLNLIGKMGQLAGVFFSDVVDVLDPGIYKQLRQVFVYKRAKIFRTSNSFCDVDLFQALPFEEKEDWFVFLGRFETMKQVTALLTAIPSLYQELKNRVKKNLHFYFLGYGSLEKGMQEMIAEKRFRHLPITIAYNDRPHEILAKSKVFFSLQLHNNYPSKSLIEALSAGNLPIVTDVGQTRWLAKPEFSYYVPENFSEKDLVAAVRKMYDAGDPVLASKSKKAREFVMQEHTIQRMQEYYLNLYAQL